MWTIFNSSVLKDNINVFLLYHSFKLTWSATSRGPVPDRSATSCIKSQRGPHEVADQSPISRQPVADKSATGRWRVADQLQNLVATPLRPLRSFWILVAERSQSGCSVYLTGAYEMWQGWSTYGLALAIRCLVNICPRADPGETKIG